MHLSVTYLPLGAELAQLVRWMTPNQEHLVRISQRPSEKNLLVLLDKALYLRLSWIMTIFSLPIMSIAMAPLNMLNIVKAPYKYSNFRLRFTLLNTNFTVNLSIDL